MRIFWALLALWVMLAPLAARGTPQDQSLQNQPVDQSFPTTQVQGSPDVFSYSYLQVNRLSEYSDYFNDRSAGNGLKFSYGFGSGVYLFGQWNRLNFEKLLGHHDLSGVGIGAHQEYNASTSFYIYAEYLRDRLSGSLGGATNNYWRVSYGMQSRVSSLISLTAAIFTERNATFGTRPFGERVGLSFGTRVVALGLFGEHTADGNRLQAALTWYYK